MPLRLIALDLDGTAIDSDRAVRPSTRAALDEARKRGIEVVLVTGRHHVAAGPYQDELGLTSPAVCCNGTYLYDYGGRSVVAGNPLSKDQARRIVAAGRAAGLKLLVYSGDAMNFEEEDDHLRGLKRWAATCPPRVRPELRQVGDFDRLIEEEPIIWKVVVSHDRPEIVRAAVDGMRETMDLAYEWSWVDRVDIARAGNSKGKRLLEWAETRGVVASEIIAFGDHLNDISMLEPVGVGVAMGNAEDEVKAIADFVTANNDDDGIALALRRFVLNQKSG